jgi:FMN phosphatase YigB (HAD superfamily)
MECAKESAVMVGNSWEFDILGAQSAGIQAVWLNPLKEACPGPTSSVQITSLEPAEEVAEKILSAIPGAKADRA